MKKHKTLLVLLFTTLLLLQTGCAKGPEISHEDIEAAILDEYQILIGYSTENSNPIIQAIADGFDVEISSISKDDDSYQVQCILSNYDVIAAFNACSKIDDEMSLNGYAQTMAETLVVQERYQLETELPLTIQEDGNYQVSFNEDQLDVAMGGFISYYKQLLEEVGE